MAGLFGGAERARDERPGRRGEQDKTAARPNIEKERESHEPRATPATARAVPVFRAERGSLLTVVGTPYTHTQ